MTVGTGFSDFSLSGSRDVTRFGAARVTSSPARSAHARREPEPPAPGGRRFVGTVRGAILYLLCDGFRRWPSGGGGSPEGAVGGGRGIRTHEDASAP